jgi:hypothetical protein
MAMNDRRAFVLASSVREADQIIAAQPATWRRRYQPQILAYADQLRGTLNPIVLKTPCWMSLWTTSAALDLLNMIKLRGAEVIDVPCRNRGGHSS